MTGRAAAHAQKVLAPIIPQPSAGYLQRKCTCGKHTPGGGECEECKKEGAILQRRSTGTVSPPEVPPIVGEVLGMSGRPLDPGVREFFEPRFSHDFSHVRVHTDARAAESARAVNAHAYTVGSHIFMGPQQPTPQSQAGRFLLAHELTHVIQQSSAHPVQSGSLVIAPADDAHEKEADGIARRISENSTGEVRQDTSTPRLQRLMCDQILNASESGGVKGIDAHAAIAAQFLANAGSNATFLSIPGGSSIPYRTECGGMGGKMIGPVVSGGKAGLGFPDLGYKSGANVELAEVKIGSWECVDFAEKQLNNYVEKGNSSTNAFWRRQKRIGRFLPMPTSRFTPISPIPVGGQRITAGWCEPGILVYKAMQDPDAETFLCGSLSDKGAVDRFLSKALDRGQAEIDRYIDQTLDPAITKVVQKLTIREGVHLLDKALKNLLKKYLVKTYGPAAGALMEAVSEEMIVDQLGQYLQETFQGEAEVFLRRMAMDLKSRLLSALRKKLQSQVRGYLQESLNTLCAAAAVGAAISIRDLLKKLQSDLPTLMVPVLVGVATELARELIGEMLKEVGKALLGAIAIVAVVAAAIFLLPEEAIAAAVAALGVLVESIGQLLIPILTGSVPIFGRLLQGAH
jgi:hypothetical protein